MGKARTKHGSIADAIRLRISAGGLRPGDRLATYQQLQTQFGAALNTVGRALIDLEADGLVRREPGRGVFVTGRTRNMGVIAAYGFHATLAASDYWNRLISGCQAEAAKVGVEILLLSGQADIRWDRLDGVLVHHDGATGFLANRPPNLPAVAVMCPAEGEASVAPDDFAAGTIATRYLVELGHRRIGWLGVLNGPTLHRRVAGYRWAMFDAGLPVDAGWLCDADVLDANMVESARLNMIRWIEQRKPGHSPTALLAQNDLYAIGMLQGCRDCGVSVPGEVSIVGFDGAAEAERCIPALTTMDIPIGETAERATAMLLRMIAGEKIEPVTILLSTRLHVRETTAAPRD